MFFTILLTQGMKELKEIAGENGEDSGDENEADMLAQDAAMPLRELLAKLKGVRSDLDISIF